MTFTENEWLCDYKGKKCTGKAVVNWMCKVESVQFSACQACYDEWRSMVVLDQTLNVRCPRCAQTPDAVKRREEARAGRTVVITDSPLQGMFADAFDNAMFREGILIDARRRILVRLAREEAWLNRPADNAAVPSG